MPHVGLGQQLASQARHPTAEVPAHELTEWL